MSKTNETEPAKREPFFARIEAMIEELVPAVKEGMWKRTVSMLTEQDPEAAQDEEFMEDMCSKAMDKSTPMGQEADAEATLGAFRLAICIEIDALHARMDALSAGERK